MRWQRTWPVQLHIRKFTVTLYLNRAESAKRWPKYWKIVQNDTDWRCIQKTPVCYCLNNSVKKEPIMVFVVHRILKKFDTRVCICWSTTPEKSTALHCEMQHSFTWSPFLIFLVCYCFDTCFLAIAVASFSAYTLLRGVFFYFVLCLFVCIVLPVEVNKVVQSYIVSTKKWMAFKKPVIMTFSIFHTMGIWGDNFVTFTCGIFFRIRSEGRAVARNYRAMRDTCIQKVCT